MSHADGPLVVIPEPIRNIEWSYDIERSILEPLGIRLLEPATEAEAAAALPDADVVFTSSPLSADVIGTFGSQCVGILCYSVGMDYVDFGRGGGTWHPDLELPDLEQRRGLGPRGPARPRRATPVAAVRDGRP